MAISGSCLCGTVNYEISQPFDFIGNCHCSICRRATGAAFATWGIFKPGTFRWTAGENSVKKYQSSPGMERCFCGNCGSHLAVAQKGVVGEVLVGCVIGDPGARPREHIFVGSKAPWFEITDTLPQSPGWPEGMQVEM